VDTAESLEQQRLIGVLGSQQSQHDY